MKYERIPGRDTDGLEKEDSKPFFSFQKVVVLSLAITAIVGTALVARRGLEEPSATSLQTIEHTLLSSNEYSRRTGREIGNGLYPHKHLVQVHKPTLLTLSSGVEAMWTLNGMPLNSEPAAEVEVTFKEVDKHIIGVSGEDLAALTFEVHARVVRYEIRSLSEADREAYFSALHTIYSVHQIEGEERFGHTFKSADWLVREHLEGAADIECDHWHDDAGILNHHIGITWQLEQSLRLVDPSTAAHYWDYTLDASEDYPWTNSPIFDDDWYGSNSPSSADHVIDSGRWAYTEVLKTHNKHPTSFSSIQNPYGLLRSPWNTNPVPYVMRSNHTAFVFADGYTTFPTCASFADFVGDSLAEVMFAVNGALHGPVHLMIGGHWDLSPKFKPLAEQLSFPDSMLLLSKWLWRQGFARTPEFCSSDTPHSQCTNYCPKEIIGDRTAQEVLLATGMTHLNPNTNFNQTLLSVGLTYDDWLAELCHFGSPGEMFTSAAPQDPTFWPLHGNAERYIQYLRLLNDAGTITMDTTWGYKHSSPVPSDTGRVCDWSGVTGMGMPTCSVGTCPGHKIDDLLPFTDIVANRTDLFTNSEFWEYVSPSNKEMPYVYDSLSFWPGCTDSSLLVEAGYTV